MHMTLNPSPGATPATASEAPPELLADLARRFTRFAEHDCRDDALCIALARAIAAEPELLALLAEAPSPQRLPVLLLAALHERVLAGVDHALAGYYASRGGTRAPDEALPALLLDFARQQDPPLRALLRQRATQTNEIGRCAVLWPALQALAWRLGGTARAPVSLALFDFGCSAGLNLGVAQYRYAWQTADGLTCNGGGTAPDIPEIHSTWRGAAPPAGLLAAPAWRLVDRHGVDPAPIDPADQDQSRWLRACVWPGDTARHRRLDQALALARRHPATRVARGDGLAELERWLDGLPAGVQPVLFNSWVLAYLDRAHLPGHHQRVARLVSERGLAWISAEAIALSPLPPPQPAPPVPEGEAPGSATLWTLQWRAPEGLRTEVLAWSHPHGRWVQWMDGPHPAMG